MSVEKLCLEQGLSYLEGCIELADTLEIDQQDIPQFITKSLRDKIERESIDSRLLKMPKPRSLDFLM